MLTLFMHAHAVSRAARIQNIARKLASHVATNTSAKVVKEVVDNAATGALLTGGKEVVQHTNGEAEAGALSIAGVYAGRRVAKRSAEQGSQAVVHVSNFAPGQLLPSFRYAAGTRGIRRSSGLQDGAAPQIKSHRVAGRPALSPLMSMQDPGELRDELVDLLGEVSDRGIGAAPELAEDLLEVVCELEDACPAPSWDQSPSLGGRWRLRYTSSKTFANNLGLTGYARDIAGVNTPDTFMTVETAFKRLVYEEPLVLEPGSLTALFGKFVNADAVQVECTWRKTEDGSMGVESQRIVVGDNAWAPADRQDKAVRVLAAARPVYLDDGLFVLRSEPAYVVWVFTKP